MNGLVKYFKPTGATLDTILFSKFDRICKAKGTKKGTVIKEFIEKFVEENEYLLKEPVLV